MLVLSPSSTKNKFTVLKTFTYMGVTVPKGYETNGADVPRIFWTFYPPYLPQFLKAIIVHDYLCDLATTQAHYKEADIKLLEGLTDIGANKLTRKLYYIGCRSYHKLRYYNIPKE